MKTHTQSILAALAVALFATGSAVANDPQWQVIDNHHGSYLYLARPSQTEATVAFGGHPKKTVSMATTTKRTNDPQWQVIDNHHGSYLYLARPSQTEATVAFGGHPKKTGSMATTTKRTNTNSSEEKLGFHEVSTPHGPVNYYGPAE